MEFSCSLYDADTAKPSSTPRVESKAFEENSKSREGILDHSTGTPLLQHITPMDNGDPEKIRNLQQSSGASSEKSM
jgi:hypothetical protein